MSRRMVDAYGRLFLHLERYCSRRGDPILTPSRPRWATSDSAAATEALKNLRLLKGLEFGSQRFLTWAELAGVHYVGLVGFDFEPAVASLQAVSLDSGFSMAILSDLLPLPTVPASHIRNVVEAGSKDEPDYSGHDPRLVEGLFPSVQVLRCVEPLDADSVWRVFLMVSADECKNGGSWISDELADGLVSLTSLDVPSLPYGALCQSMFDSDPRSMYMAIYRCIEATYAYESSRRLVERLHLDLPWLDLATALDEEVGWHPQEAQSLNLVLRYALPRDLQELCDCLGAPVGDDLQASAGKGIYALRNRIVHYRPGVAPFATTEFDWNRLCGVMIDIVFHVFTRAYMPP